MSQTGTQNLDRTETVTAERGPPRNDHSTILPVGLAWTALEGQAGAAERWDIDGPWEVTLALRGCGGAALGGFAEGWQEPDDFRSDLRVCLEEHALHRWEVDSIEPDVLAEQIGQRTENTFGSTHRRHLANRGPFDGKFDPRFGW